MRYQPAFKFQQERVFKRDTPIQNLEENSNSRNIIVEEIESISHYNLKEPENKMRFEGNAAVKIQKVFRGHVTRKSRKKTLSPREIHKQTLDALEELEGLKTRAKIENLITSKTPFSDLCD